MNDQDAPLRGRGSTDEAGTSSASWWRSLAVVAPAVALVVGLVIGGVVVGAGETSGSSRPSPTATVTVTDAAEPTPSDTSVVIPQACLDAAETVEEATDVLRDGVGAVRGFRRSELVDLLNRLEDLETQARDEATTCSEVEVTSPTGSTG